AAAAASVALPAGAATVEIAAPIKPSQAPLVEDVLTELGFAPRFGQRARLKEERYRGSSYTTTVNDLHVVVVVDAERAVPVLAALGALEVTATVAEAPAAAAPDVVPAGTDVAATPATEPASTGPAPASVVREAGLACVVALADPGSQ